MRLSIKTRFILLPAVFLSFMMKANAQQLKLGSDPTVIDKSAVLQLDSKNQGLLITRVPDTNNFVPDPPDGMIIYFIDHGTVDDPSTYGSHAGLYVRRGGWWNPLILGIYSLNGSNVTNQTFATGTSGRDFNIYTDAVTGVHTFNLPDASPSARGVVTTGSQSIGGTKKFDRSPIDSVLQDGSVVFINDTLAEDNNDFYWDHTNKRLGIGQYANTPSNTLTVNSGTSGSSGITTPQMTAATPVATTDSSAGIIGVDANGKIVRTVAVKRVFNYPTATQRPLNTVIDPIDNLQDVYVTYSISLNVSAQLLTNGQSAKATLQVSPNGSSDWQTVSQVSLSNKLVVGELVSLGGNITSIQALSGWIPAGDYLQIITNNTSGGTITYVSGQEVAMQ